MKYTLFALLSFTLIACSTLESKQIKSRKIASKPGRVDGLDYERLYIFNCEIVFEKPNTVGSFSKWVKVFTLTESREEAHVSCLNKIQTTTKTNFPGRSDGEYLVFPGEGNIVSDSVVYYLLTGIHLR